MQKQYILLLFLSSFVASCSTYTGYGDYYPYGYASPYGYPYPSTYSYPYYYYPYYSYPKGYYFHPPQNPWPPPGFHRPPGRPRGHFERGPGPGEPFGRQTGGGTFRGGGVGRGHR